MKEIFLANKHLFCKINPFLSLSHGCTDISINVWPNIPAATRKCEKWTTFFFNCWKKNAEKLKDQWKYTFKDRRSLLCSSEWPNKGLDAKKKKRGLSSKDNRWTKSLFIWNLIGSQLRRKKTKRRGRIW